MAISGYNSVNISNNVPFNNDPGQIINQGDMLYWNTEYQAFEVGSGISKLSDLNNDLNYLTEAQVLELIAGLQSGGTLDLSTYATDAEVSSAISTAIAGINSFSGDYNDLKNKPVLFSGSYTDLTNRPALFSGYYEDLQNKPDLSNYATINQVNQAIANIDYDYLVTEAELANALQNIDYSRFVTDAELANALSNIDSSSIDLSKYYTKLEIASILDSYEPTVDLSAYALKTELFSGDYNDLINAPTIPDTTGLATTAYVDQQIANVSTGGTVDLTNYYTKPQVDALIPSLSGYATQTYVDNAVSGYATQAYVNNAIQSIDYTNLVTEAELANALQTVNVTVDLTNYYTKAEVDTAIATALTGGTVDLTGYVTDGELAAALANYQPTIDLTGYATDLEVSGLLTNYYTTSQVDAMFTAAGAGIQNLDDLNDVAIGSLPAIDNADDFYLLEYNPVTQLWESRNFGNVFATQAYVSATVATAITNGTINLDGYATEQYVEQALLERGPHFSGDYNELTNTPQLFSGSYNDLLNKPTLPTYTLTRDGTIVNLIETAAEPDTIAGTIDIADLVGGFSGDYNDLVNKPRLFSGSYLDLTNKPYIPSIAGLASEEYVDNRIAEVVITGDKIYTNGVTFEDYVQQKLSTADFTAIKRDLVLAVQTTNDIETEVLFPDATRVGVAVDTTAMFKATVVASSGVDKTAFIVKGVIDYTGTLSIVGNNIIETISDSDMGWTASFSADTVNEALKVTVTGSAATVVDWTVFLEISEVIR